MTSQDFVKGIDLTGQTTITATQLNQLVDVCRAAIDKGLVIETTDTALDTPVVPNPNVELEGVTPTWWKRYIWKRNLFTTGVKSYLWDDTVTSTDPYLKWIDTSTAVDEALADAAAALTAAQAAQATADLAASDATTAIAVATNSDAIAYNAKVAADAATAAVASMSPTITGAIIPFAGSRVFSTTANEGYLECDGSAVSRSIFSNLFSAVGALWGSGDGTTTFNVPDLRGRTLIGAGQGDDLSARTITSKVGKETHILTTAESGRHEHTNLYADNTAHDAASGTGNTDCNLLVSTAAAGGHAKILNSHIGTEGTNDAHENMQPSTVIRWLIKT